MFSPGRAEGLAFGQLTLRQRSLLLQVFRRPNMQCG